MRHLARSLPLIIVGLVASACGNAGTDGDVGSSLPLTTSVGFASPLAFEWGDYLARYGDLGAAGIDNEAGARLHWQYFGIEEGRQGTPWLNPKDYLETNDDLRALFTDPTTKYARAVDHFVSFGVYEDRVGAPFDRQVFDWQYYTSHNADLAPYNEAQARWHWAHYGMAEGRRASRVFCVRDYLARYADLSSAFGSDYRAAIRHWLVFGAREGRLGASDARNVKRVGMLYSVWHGLASSAQRYRSCLGASGAVADVACVGEALTVSDVILARASGSSRRLKDIYPTQTLRDHAANFHYLNRPVDGFYSLYRKRIGETPVSYGGLPVLDSRDARTIARRHADQLVAAGIDFVYIDLSNLGEKSPVADILQLRPLEVLFEEWSAYRAEGGRTPEISVFAPAPADVDKNGLALWRDYLKLYNRPEYSDLVARDVYTGKKLFFLTDSGYPTQLYDPSVASVIASNGGRDDVLALRMGWPGPGQETLRNGTTQWMSPCREGSVVGSTTSFVAAGTPCSQNYTPFEGLGGYPNTGSFVNVAAAFHTNYSSRFGGSSGANGGLTLKKMFERAFAMHPDFLLLNEWNEHIAQPQPFDVPGVPGDPIDPEVFSMGLDGDLIDASDDSKFVPDGRSGFVDHYAMDYSRDMEPTVENGGQVYDVLRSCMRVYRRGGASSCSDPSERCCNLAENDHFRSVYSLKSSGNDYMVTTSRDERASLLASGSWAEIKNRFRGSSEFPQGTSSVDKFSGPFVVDTVAGPNRVAVYRCRAADHFLSVATNCEGYGNDGVVGYVAARPEGAYLRPLLRCAGATHFHVLAGGCPSGSRFEQRLGFVK